MSHDAPRIRQHPENILRMLSRGHRQRLRFLTRANRVIVVTVTSKFHPGSPRFRPQLVFPFVKGWQRMMELHPADATQPELAQLVSLVDQLTEVSSMVERCRHCDVLWLNDAKGTECDACAMLCNSEVLTSKCVICKTRDHPVRFTCDNCRDSQICSFCFPELPRAKRGCQICQQPSIQKRKRWSESDLEYSEPSE